MWPKGASLGKEGFRPFFSFKLLTCASSVQPQLGDIWCLAGEFPCPSFARLATKQTGYLNMRKLSLILWLLKIANRNSKNRKPK
jgi:hypothetical protein